MLAVKRLPPGARWLVRDMAVKTGRSEQEVEETILDLLAAVLMFFVIRPLVRNRIAREVVNEASSAKPTKASVS